MPFGASSRAMLWASPRRTNLPTAKGVEPRYPLMLAEAPAKRIAPWPARRMLRAAACASYGRGSVLWLPGSLSNWAGLDYNRSDLASSSPPAGGSGMARRMVVLDSPHERAYPLSHEHGTRIELARRLASFKGFDFAGEYDPSRRYKGPLYFVPSDTLTSERANQLGIRSEGDLLGGVVPYAFAATKVITHPLVEPDACAPAGWSRDFAHHVHDHVLVGFSVFTHEDARRVGARLLGQGPVRVKPVRASGGQGQKVISSAAELEGALRSLHATALLQDGLVLEENLNDVTTYSVGEIRVAEH